MASIRTPQRQAAYTSPLSKLVAACDVFPPSVENAKKYLPADTVFYTDPNDLLSDANVEAVIIATATETHVPLCLAAMKAGKHILLEKPISTAWEITANFAAEVKKFPHLKVMMGMARRFDDSYSDAKARIDEGQLGRTYMVKAASNDLFDPSTADHFVKYAAKSGGIFLDAGIHDIDAARWLLQIGEKDKVKKVFAIGTIVKFKDLAQFQDADNALAVVEFHNGKFFTFHTGRTTTHGHECMCEIFGENGRFTINQNPRLNRLDISDAHGVRAPSMSSFYERLREAFVHELNAFSQCILKDMAVPISVGEVVEAEKIAHALMRAFRTGETVKFDSNGDTIDA
ncbi:unnamed protein product [Clonostachys chloroleuca]|uniref:Uncharacterized protein n=1 Tax=Clonostachys chloroleuca TaxID=1926264 RepID=A0AA35LQE0_9HYPO|nr:unnamed protein product [Clonostachys chloroleuca]